MKLTVIDLNGIGEEGCRALLQFFPAARSAERSRAENAAARLQSTVAEAAVLLEIMQTLRLSPENISISRTAEGKPYLVGFPHFQFNISHTEGLAVCAFDALPVGVDAEKVRPIDFRAVAARCFTRREQEKIARESDPMYAFFRLWTAKESVVKQRGTTLARALCRLDVSERAILGNVPLSCTVTTYGLDKTAQTLSENVESAPYVLSVCRAENAEGPITTQFLSAAELPSRISAASPRTP